MGSIKAWTAVTAQGRKITRSVAHRDAAGDVRADFAREKA